MILKKYYVAVLEKANGEEFYDYYSGPHDYDEAWSVKTQLGFESTKDYHVVSVAETCKPE